MTTGRGLRIRMLILVVSLTLWSIGFSSTDPRIPIYLMHIQNPWGSTDLGLNVDFCIDQVNSRDNVLPNYKLHAQHKMVSRLAVGESVKAFIELLAEPPAKLMILGPPFSSMAMVVADAAKYYNLVEIGSSLTSPLLSDATKYALFARVVESTMLHNPAMVEVLKFFSWRRIAKIVQDTGFVMAAAQNLQPILNENNITTIATTTYSGDPTAQLFQIRDSGAKIIISFGGRNTYCLAYHMGLYGPHYQWLHWSGLHGGLSSHSSSLGVGNCTQAQMQNMMDGMMFFSPISVLINNENITTVSGYTPRETSAQYQSWLAERNASKTLLRMSSTMCDAVWASALTLNASVPHLPANFTLDQFTYSDAHIAKLFFNQLTKLQFQGMSGSIAFDEIGDRKSEVVISQGQGDKLVTIGSYSPFTETLTWNKEAPPKFPGGRPPKDSVVTLYRDVQTDKITFFALGSLCCLGVLFCCCCVAFNILFATIRLVKLSSPRINTLIAVGCAMSYISVILVGLDGLYVHDDTVFCTLKAWLLVFGFTAAFGGMFAKTWRVHVLFTNKKLTRKVVKDSHLFALVSGIGVVDAVILASWTLADPLYWSQVLLPQELVPGNDGLIIQPRVRVCTSNFANYWTGAISGFKALMLVFGIFFAWETRQVRIEALNDSKQIGMCVYNVMIMSVIAVPLVNLLTVSQVTISFGVTAIAVLICSTATLGLVFGAKMFLVATKGSQVQDLSQLPFAASLKKNTMTDHQTEYSAQHPSVHANTMNPTSGPIPSISRKC